MKKFIGFCLLAIFVACEAGVEDSTHIKEEDISLSHGLMVLGEKLENPYKTENVRNAYSSMYPTKSRDDIKTTNFYVRFLPETQADFDQLESMGLELLDHPVDYRVKVDGDYYQDPKLGENEITWQYSVGPQNFEFPVGIRYEVLDECFLADNSPVTRAMVDVDWDAVEQKSYQMTGNADMIVPKSRSQEANPTGRITIIDDKANGGKPVGVSGVRVMCNTFIKFSYAYTDRDGYYKIPRTFSSQLRYRLVFKNEKNFAIGLNLILVPASVSTLGEAGPEGLNVSIDKNSDKALFTRSVVNNAAYDYILRCSQGDMGIKLPPSDLRLWIFYNISPSSAPMIHHGVLVEREYMNKYLNIGAKVVQFFAPDITIGAKGKHDYETLCGPVYHEMAHASHFAKVGKEYWNKYIYYILRTFVSNMVMDYGSGTGDGSGHCEVGEMWAFYMETQLLSERYGFLYPTEGTSFWFHPQILRYLEDRGLSRSDVFGAMDSSVNSRESFQKKLSTLYPTNEPIIRQAFTRYE